MNQGCGYDRRVTPKKCVVEKCGKDAVGFTHYPGHMCRGHWDEYWKDVDTPFDGG